MPRALSEMSTAPVNTTALIQTRASLRKMTATKMSAFEDFVLGSEWLAKGDGASAPPTASADLRSRRGRGRSAEL